MSNIAETYIVVSLLMAVFAAVAAVGTALVLGVGFERLRCGFEIVRKQTAFFSDAIRKLDDQTSDLDERTTALEGATVVLDQKTRSLEEHQNDLAREMKESAVNHIHAEKTEAAIRHSEDLLTQVAGIARKVEERQARIAESSMLAKPAPAMFEVPTSFMQHILGQESDRQIRFH